MARYSIAAASDLAGRIAVQIQRDEPLVEVVVDADRRRHDATHPGRHDREAVAEVEEDDRLVLGEHFLQSIVVLLAVGLDARAPPLFEELVGLGIRVADAVELVGGGLGRMPDVVLIRVGRDPQARMTVSKFRFLMYSFRSAAHSMTRISTWTPMSLSEAWMISATFRPSSLPCALRRSNLNGCPFLSRMPSEFFSFQPAAASGDAALAGSDGYWCTFGLYCYVPGL